GFPYADVAEMGASVLVVAERNHAAAARCATELAQVWWSRRAEFDTTLPSAAEAVDRAARLDGPVCLLDTGDNIGGGSPGDGTVLAHELHRRKVGPAFVCLADPDAVKAATAAEIGAQIRLRVGGKHDNLHGAPLEAEFTVRLLVDGRSSESKPRHGGITEFDRGPNA